MQTCNKPTGHDKPLADTHKVHEASDRLTTRANKKHELRVASTVRNPTEHKDK